MTRTREIRGEPGYCHWVKRSLVVLGKEGAQSRNSTRYFERWKELHAISRQLRLRGLVRLPRRAVVELLAFQTHDREIGLRDMIDRSRFTDREGMQQAPYQIYR